MLFKAARICLKKVGILENVTYASTVLCRKIKNSLVERRSTISMNIVEEYLWTFCVVLEGLSNGLSRGYELLHLGTHCKCEHKKRDLREKLHSPRNFVHFAQPLFITLLHIASHVFGVTKFGSSCPFPSGTFSRYSKAWKLREIAEFLDILKAFFVWNSSEYKRPNRRKQLIKFEVITKCTKQKVNMNRYCVLNTTSSQYTARWPMKLTEEFKWENELFLFT